MEGLRETVWQPFDLLTFRLAVRPNNRFSRMSVRRQLEVSTSCPFHPARSLLFVCRLMAETPIWDRRLLQILQRASELEAVGIIISNDFFSPLRRARPRWRRLCAAVTRCVSAFFFFCQMVPIMCSLAVQRRRRTTKIVQSYLPRQKYSMSARVFQGFRRYSAWQPPP